MTNSTGSTSVKIKFLQYHEVNFKVFTKQNKFITPWCLFDTMHQPLSDVWHLKCINVKNVQNYIILETHSF